MEGEEEEQTEAEAVEGEAEEGEDKLGVEVPRMHLRALLVAQVLQALQPRPRKLRPREKAGILW